MVCGAVSRTASTWQSPRQVPGEFSACGCGLWITRVSYAITMLIGLQTELSQPRECEQGFDSVVVGGL